MSNINNVNVNENANAHVKVNAHLLELENDILRGSHRIIVLAPSSNLMVVQK